MSETTKTEKNPEKNPELTPAQKRRLEALEASIRVEGVTVSFFIEERDANGRKKSAFNSLRSVRGDGIANTWTPEESQVVACSLSKQVVVATYRDAVHRGVMGTKTAAEEAKAIGAHYDNTMANLIRKSDEEAGD